MPDYADDVPEFIAYAMSRDYTVLEFERDDDTDRMNVADITEHVKRLEEDG